MRVDRLETEVKEGGGGLFGAYSMDAARNNKGL